MNADDVRDLLYAFVPTDGRPLVVYSGIWQFARYVSVAPRELPSVLIAALLDVAGPDRTVIMPTYTAGYEHGRLNLDQAPSRTGVLTEAFRKWPGSLRTASAFFSFACHGPDAERLTHLRPHEAWGDDSVFEWIEETNAEILTLGVSLDSISFTHRAEWLADVPYRYDKSFSGTIVLRGREQPLEETLFVRQLSPEVTNRWESLDAILPAAGVRAARLGSGQIASVAALDLVKVQLAALAEDPFCFADAPRQASLDCPQQADRRQRRTGNLP